MTIKLMTPFFKYYRFFTTERGNIIGRPVNPNRLYPMWPGFKALNEAYFEFDKWADKHTFYVCYGSEQIKPGIYDKADIVVSEWLIETEDDYRADSEIPIDRIRIYCGDECDEVFLLYCLKEPQKKFIEINNN